MRRGGPREEMEGLQLLLPLLLFLPLFLLLLLLLLIRPNLVTSSLHLPRPPSSCYQLLRSPAPLQG